MYLIPVECKDTLKVINFSLVGYKTKFVVTFKILREPE